MASTGGKHPAHLPLADIDENELSSENGEVYLFRWLAEAEKIVEGVSLSDLKPIQSTLESSLLKIISSPSPYPLPGRAIRNLVGRIVVALYRRGETRSMFDVLQSLLRIVAGTASGGASGAVAGQGGSGAAEKTAEKDREVIKTAAWWCIGDLMGVYGANVMSFMAEITTSTIKTYRTSSNSTLLRYHALIALSKSLNTAKRAVQDSTMRDLVKQMKSALTDKSLAIQRAACEVLIAVYSVPDPIPFTSSELDSLITQSVKSLDTADQITRHAHAQLIGHILASSQVERVVISLDSSKPVKKDGRDGDGGQGLADDDDSATGGGVGGATKSGGTTETLKPMFTSQEMLLRLSVQFNKPSASKKTRIGIFAFYSALLNKLGPGFCETNYGLVYAHFLQEIVSSPRLVNPPASTSPGVVRYETLLVRRLVGMVMRDLVGVRMLSEQGQIGAIQELAALYLKRWPAMMPGQVAPSGKLLVVALKEVAGLVMQLGNAPPPVQNSLAEPLVSLLSHPSHTVRVTAAWALRCFCFSTPLRLAKTIITITDKLQRDLSALLLPASSSTTSSSSSTTPEIRALGHAHALSALMSLIPLLPLYVSYDVPSKILDMTTSLLKRAGEHPVKTADVEVEVAWSVLAGLMSIGPGFVRQHLASLMVLWRNALPKVMGRDKDTAMANGRTPQEWGFMLHVREAALGCIWCFLERNQGLVTLDVARRVASLLSNALSFANSFVSSGVQDDATTDPSLSTPASAAPSSTTGTTRKTPTLRDRESLLRRRIHQCFTSLSLTSLSSIPAQTQVILLQSAISHFASPEGFAGSVVQAAIASSTGSVGSVWAGGDGYGYGVTGEDVWAEFGEEGRGDSVEVGIDVLNRMPVLGALEHDPLSLCHASSASSQSTFASSSLSTLPPTTSVIDTSIELFARLLPLQDLSTTQKILQTLLENVKSGKMEKNAGRKMAVWVNAGVAMVRCLRAAGAGGQGAHGMKEVWGNAGVTSLISGFLMESLIDGDPILRTTSSESIGRLASLSGTSHLTSQIKDLVDQVVNNRNPSSRAGCALAFGSIYTHVGGLAAGPLLKTTVNVLMSLIADPHPTVHFYSLNALGSVINAASLAYAGYVSKTLGLMVKVYMGEGYEKEGGSSAANSNLAGDLGAIKVVCGIVDSVVTVLGPDILDFSGAGEGGKMKTTKMGTLINTLISEFLQESDEAIVVEAIRCVQHFMMFTQPDEADVQALVSRFRGYLGWGGWQASTLGGPRGAVGGGRQVKVAAINALYQLVQRDAVGMARVGGDGLVEDLFGMLDDDQSWTGGNSGAGSSGDGGAIVGSGAGDAGGGDGSVRGVQSVIRSWLSQTGVLNPGAWIDLCWRIMKRTTTSQEVADANKQQAGIKDDEGESIIGGSGSTDGDAAAGSGRKPRRLTSRWRTQLFALQCLHEICLLVAQSGRKEHVDAIYARQQGFTAVNSQGLLFSRVGDLIKMAFTASTAYVTEIRLAGLVVLRDVIEIFAKSPDPAYDDALLLEQHQAPITAALTPAFSSDSTPEILASAVHACAVFVGCGVVKDVGRMGRILKLLTTALEQSKDSGMLSLGETGELSPNASAMLRISTLSAWAELQVSSLQQTYLENVVKPYRGTLCGLWVAALRDYAGVRIDSEFLHDTGGGGGIDKEYLSLGKEVLLPYYTLSWSIVLHAVATAMQKGDPHILAAMDGKEPTEQPKELLSTSGSDRKDPTAFFYVVFGLIYEALSTSSPASSASSLSAPSSSSSSGSSSSSNRQSIVLTSLLALKYLLKPEYAGQALMEPMMFDEFISLCYRMGMTEGAKVQIALVEMLAVFAQLGAGNGKDNEDKLSLTEPRAHCLRICSNILKQATNLRVSFAQGHLSDRIAVISSSISAFTSIATSIASSQREDVRGVAILLYCDLLKDETSEIDFVSPTLPGLKTLLDLPVANGPDDKDRYSKLVHAVLSSCLLNIDSMRGRVGNISNKKMKNNMLAAVLILTVVPAWVKIGRAAVEHACFLITQKLLDTNEICLTAAHCTKTLILASSSGNPTLRQCARLLTPGLIEFIAKMAPVVHDGTITEAQAAAVSEVWKAFGGLVTASAEELRPRVLGVLLPTISLLLGSSTPPQPIAASLVSQTISQLLTFASTSPAAFKEAAGKLDTASRELLETSIRKAVGGQGTGQSHAARGPQISLRSF